MQSSYKVVLLGEGRVGKTSLVLRFCRDTFTEGQPPTIQASCLDKVLRIGEKSLHLVIWDTAGQERFHALGPIYYRDADAALLVFDITDAVSVDAAVEKVVATLGRVDILINNAAAGRGADRTTVPELSEKDFDRVVDVKVKGSFLCTRAFIREVYKQKSGGKIVNVASVAGKRGSSKTLAYNAANFAVVGMTQSMASEFGPHNVNVNIWIYTFCT